MLRFIFALFVGFSLGSAVEAAPRNGRVVEGAGSIERSGNHTDIRQQSDFLATSWDSFNIAAHESVQAHQPAASSRLLIRVDGGGGATNIAGSYTSNGITILENRNGVQFSRGAIVNVGGLLATSSRISGVAGANWQLNGTGGAVVNHGQIAAGAGGVVLAAVRVENHGKITAQGGDVALGAGSSFTVDFAGSMVGFEVKKAADGASVVHDGVIESQGGIVSLSAQEAQAVRTNVVSVGGVVKATRIERRGGVVYLSGGDEGIAEVSGDVSASRKVQTTGEYVVVKGSAVLRAPEILVGGDFQGKGDVPTSRRTLVERGALLDAGAEGRVIVWSDETTWFNGDISAPGGFAEVSGKETLASVHLAGIDVGELLLDPADIIIAATSTTTTAVTTDIAAADPGTTLTLDVATINDLDMDLSLAATNTIMVNVAISKMTGDLTLIAGGVLTLGANITTSAGDLALTGASMALSGAATLTGAAITITAPTINIDTHALTITATGVLTLDTVGMITGTGTAALSLEGDTIAGLSTALTLNVPTVSLTLTLAAMLGSGGLVSVPGASFGATAPFAADSDIGTLNLAVSTPQTYHTWMAAEDRNLSLRVTNFSELVIGVAEIDLGAGNLTLFAINTIIANPAGLTIRAGNFSHGGALCSPAFSSNNCEASASNGLRVFADGNITLSTTFSIAVPLEFRADNDGDGMGMIMVTGTSAPNTALNASSLILQQAGEFVANSVFASNSAATGSVSFRVTTAGVDQVIHPWMTALGGTDFSLRGLEGEGSRAAVVLNSITLPASLTRTGDIDLQATTINLSANAALSGANVALSGEITAASSNNNSLSITATAGAITINDNIDLGTTGNLTLTSSGSGSGINLGAAIMLTANNITLTGAIASANNDLTITAATLLTLNSNIDRGTGDLTLALGTSQAVFNGVRMLSGNVVTIGGTLGLETDGDLTISAGGNLMVNTNISLGSGATTTLRLEAGRGTGTGDISFSSNTLELRASRFFLTQDGAVFSNVRPVAFQDANGDGLTAGQSKLITRITYDGTATQTEVDWANILPNTVSRGPGGTADFEVAAADFVSGVLAAAVSITLDAGTGVLTFAATGDITLRAPTITITAGMIDLGADRTLTLTAETGTLTLNFTAATTITGTVTGMGTAGLSVIAEDIAFSGMPPILNVPTVSLGLTDSGSSFGATAPFAANSMIGTLNITTNEPATAGLEYRDWMAAVGRNLTITSALIRIGSTAINLGTGNLTFNSSFGIRLADAAGLTITAGNVTFPVGSLRTSEGVDISQLVVMASGDIVISDTSLPMARVELRADNGNITIHPDIAGIPGIDVNVLLMRQMGMFADNFISSRNSDIGELILRTTTAVDQPIYDWMQGAIGDPNNSGTTDGTSFSLAGEGVVLNSITLPAAADFGTTAIDLQATAIALTAATTLTGGAISLTGAITASNNLTITAMGVLTLNSDITLTGAGLTLALSSAGAISNGGNVGPNRPALTASTVSLAQDAAFATTGPFRFAAGSLEFTTDAVQDVHNWMIRDNINLTVTSALQVRVGAAIGDGNRDLGTGDLTLTSTGGAIRIFENISTGGNITLNGSTGINFNSGAGAKTLSGAAITLTGNALSNRALTLTASGVLTLNGDITAGTSALSLSGSSVALGGALTLTGGSITINNAITGAANASLAITADTLTLNNDITLTGTTSILALRSRRGAITGGAVLRAPTVRLRQVAAFADTEPFNFSTTGSLLLITDTNQEVHDWMIARDRNLTVRSSRRVRVMMGGAIGSGGDRNLGTGSLTLRSTGGAVRIVADIATGGDVTLTASGTLTINNPITLTGDGLTLALSSAGAISNGDRVGANRPRLTASTVSLAQDAAFAIRPFGFTAGSLALTTDAVQDVLDWMIVAGRNLTVTSALQVRVGAAIGDGNRDLGTGDLTLTSTGGAVRIVANITTGGAITLSGGTGGINLNDTIPPTGTAVALTGAAITLSGTALSNRALAITTTTDALRVENNITLTGTSNLSLMSATVVRIFADISTGGDITLSGGTIGINFNNRGAKTLSGAAIMLTGAAVSNRDLTLTASGTLTLDSDITLTGAVLTLALSGQSAITGTAMLTAPTVRLRQVAAFAEVVPFTFGSATGSLEFTTTANQDVRDWMINDGINLTVTSSRRVRVNAAIGSGNRDLGAGSLTLRSTGGIIRILADISTTGSLTLIGPGTIVGMGMPVLTAGTVSFTQDAAFAATALFMFGAATGSLEFTTTARQDVHNWMIRENTNLTVESPGRVRVNAAIGPLESGRNLGTGALTLTSTGGAVRILANITTGGAITLSGGTGGINLNDTIPPTGTAVALTGAAITLTGVVVSNRALTLTTTTDALRVENNITLTGTSNLSLMSATVVRIFADISTGGDITLSGGTIGINFNNRGAKTLSGAAIMLTGAAVSNRDLTITASGILTLNSNIIATGTSALSLSGSSVSLGGAARTITGRAITLRGAATGTADLTLTASGTLTISNDITLTGDGLTLTLSGAGAISNGGNGGANRPALTASTVSFTQDAAFATTGPFRFGSATGSLEFTTTVNQDVHNWMIRENTNLTVTSSNRVRVLAAIGEDERGRILGGGSLTLTSTGRIVRIVADISTTGDVTITASSILTINNDINIGTGALTLEATSFDFGSSVDLAAGSHSFTPILTCNTGTSPSCTVNNP